jgi:hypothetical protein
VMGNPFIFINSAPEVVKNKMFEWEPKTEI